MNLLKKNILHTKVLNIVNQDEGIILFLNDGSLLSLYNSFKEPIISSVIGMEITEVELNEKYLKITFDDIKEFEMGMQDCDYIGPEAFFYYGKNGVMISN